MIIDKRLFVWIIKKIIGGFERVVLVECWLLIKESKRLRRDWKIGR